MCFSFETSLLRPLLLGSSKCTVPVPDVHVTGKENYKKEKDPEILN
jgi:hypothetical protein